MRITKKQWTVIAVIVVGAAAVVWLSMHRQSGIGAVPGASSPQAYTTAVNTYLGARIQFDMYCQAQPTSLVFKSPATIMLDNRSGDARIIKVGGTSYSLAGYGWRIITVSSSTLPANIPIDCGSAKNVSYIKLQK
jgi:drug/metabolite transporter (DMT)-like permease